MRTVDLPPSKHEQLMAMSEAHYLPFGYHGLDHRSEILDHSLEVAARAMTQGVEIDRQRLELDVAWHDAGLSIMPSDFMVQDGRTLRPARHSEEVAGELFGAAALEVGIPKGVIRAVKEDINGTNPNEPVKSNEAKALAAGDLKIVGFGSYERFLGNSELLWEEMQRKSGNEVPWEDFVRGAINYLGLYTGRQIKLTPDYFDGEGRSAWHVGAMDNILRLAGETFGEEPRIVADLGIATPVETDTHGAKQAVLQIFGSDRKSSPINLRLPIEDALSLPDKVVSELRVLPELMKLSHVAERIGRVLRGSAELIIKKDH